LKQLLGLHPFQNLLLIVYDHINYDLRDYSASIWAKQQEATAQNDFCCFPSATFVPLHYLLNFRVFFYIN